MNTINPNNVEYRAKFRLFVASPGDVMPERKIVDKVLAEYNASEGRWKQVALEAFRWEKDAFPELHPHGAQGAIDDQAVIEDRDLIIGIFWTRFGTETDSGETGTEHELKKAFDSWKIHGTPQVMLFIKDAAYRCKSKADTDQWGRVFAFVSQLPKEYLTTSFKSTGNFEEKLRIQLPKMVAYLSNPDITRTFCGRLGSSGFQLSSPRSRHPARIEFINRTGEDVRLNWVDFDGRTQPIETLKPGGSGAQNSFLGHLFLAETTDGRMQLFKVKVPESTAEIARAGMLETNSPDHRTEMV